MVSGFLEGPLSKWWYSQVAQTGDEVGGGFSGVSKMEKSLIQEKLKIEIIYNNTGCCLWAPPVLCLTGLISRGRP
jgi:hypothetical protein